MRANVGVKFISREGVISNELRKARCELSREGCLILLNRFAFSALKRLLRERCVSFVGVKFISREGVISSELRKARCELM